MTSRKKIIVITNVDKTETWGSLTELCVNHPDFSYHYLKGMEFPFDYKGWRFVKCGYREKS